MTDFTFPIRPYPQHGTRYHDTCKVEGCDKPRDTNCRHPYCKEHYAEYMRIKKRESCARRRGIQPSAPVRYLTARERHLDTLAERYDDTCLVWHRDSSGEFVGFEGISPDRVCVAVQSFNVEGE